jgi:hypothetical protein
VYAAREPIDRAIVGRSKCPKPSKNWNHISPGRFGVVAPIVEMIPLA